MIDRDELTHPGFESFVVAARDHTEMYLARTTKDMSIITWTSNAATPWELGMNFYSPADFSFPFGAMNLMRWAELWGTYRKHSLEIPDFAAVAVVHDIEIVSFSDDAIETTQKEMLGFAAVERWNSACFMTPVVGVDDHFERSGPWGEPTEDYSAFMREILTPMRRLLTLQG